MKEKVLQKMAAENEAKRVENVAIQRRKLEAADEGQRRADSEGQGRDPQRQIEPTLPPTCEEEPKATSSSYEPNP
jgi:hypothetical protein